MKKIGIGLLCVAVLGTVAGCGGKDDSDTKTTQQTQDFKGHQPTPAELQAAMSKTSPPPANSNPQSK